MEIWTFMVGWIQDYMAQLQIFCIVPNFEQEVLLKVNCLHMWFAFVVLLCSSRASALFCVKTPSGWWAGGNSFSSGNIWLCKGSSGTTEEVSLSGFPSQKGPDGALWSSNRMVYWKHLESGVFWFLLSVSLQDLSLCRSCLHLVSSLEGRRVTSWQRSFLKEFINAHHPETLIFLLFFLIEPFQFFLVFEFYRINLLLCTMIDV